MHCSDITRWIRDEMFRKIGNLPYKNATLVLVDFIFELVRRKACIALYKSCRKPWKYDSLLTAAIKGAAAVTYTISLPWEIVFTLQKCGASLITGSNELFLAFPAIFMKYELQFSAYEFMSSSINCILWNIVPHYEVMNSILINGFTSVPNVNFNTSKYSIPR